MLASTAAEAAVISSIVVTGNTRIDADTVRNYVLIEPGQSFGSAEIDESVKALYGTGLFSDVTISVNGSRLVVSVVENPIVNTVIIRGNKKIKNDVLIQLLQTEPRGVLTDAKLQGDVQRITDYYASQGRSEATVESIVTPLPDNRVDVVFQINEGGRTAIGRVTFVGNNAFSDSRLASVIESKRRSILTLLSRKDIFNEAKLAQDQEELRRFYMSNGYADFRVISVDWEFNEANDRYTVVFTVEEGPRYRFGSIDIDSTVPGLDANSLRRFISTRPGRVFDSSEIERTIEAMSLELSRSGYSFAQVRPRGDRDYSNNTISITYLVDEGPRLYVERIEIIGNTKTRDYVIRREFDFAEGDPYNRVLVDRAERKLRDLQYFKTVSITTEPGSAPDRVILVVQVEEESTGEFAIGAGLSTEGIVAELSLDERNFLGRGQQLRIAVGFGKNEQTYNISFTDPYFLGQNVSAGVDAFKIVQKQTSYRPYDFDAIGGGVRLGLPITDRLTINTNYRYKNQEISNSKKATRMYFPEGTTIVSSAGYGFTYNSLDSRVDPRKGWWVNAKQEFAGLGGDVSYLKTEGEARFYTEILPQADVVGFVKVAGGNIMGLNGEQVRTIDNFFKGGETIRGFANYGYGVVDKATDTPLGGTNYWAATAEVNFPFPGISPDFGLRGALFADAGNLWGIDVPPGGGPVIDPNVIRSSVGGSVLWSSPIGVLRADAAYALTKAKTDTTQWFRFSAGRTF
ncbi:MAG TPA: outer membrane protein assembly factor BamA [Bauldia sp.]|nr:outer membrane protein assembly factor BamA [Bauldia sp.]